MTTPRTHHTSLEAAIRLGPHPAGNLAVPVFAHGSLVAEWYAPRERDQQQPHSRDEIYVVAQGHGVFFDGTGHHEVSAGSFIFVPAGQVHYFEAFTDDFGTWVFFYGPEGGEAPGL